MFQIMKELVSTNLDTQGDGQIGTVTVANPYHYADNTPLDRLDPLGLSSRLDGPLSRSMLFVVDPNSDLPRCPADTKLGHRLTAFDTSMHSIEGGGTPDLHYRVRRGGPGGVERGCPDVYDTTGGSVWEVKQAMAGFSILENFALGGGSQVRRYVKALEADGKPARIGEYFEPHFIANPVFPRDPRVGFVTYSGIDNYAGVRFYIPVNLISTLAKRQKWERVYDSTISKRDKKKMFKWADDPGKVKDRVVIDIAPLIVPVPVPVPI
jgi:hypothetical protein